MCVCVCEIEREKESVLSLSGSFSLSNIGHFFNFLFFFLSFHDDSVFAAHVLHVLYCILFHSIKLTVEIAACVSQSCFTLKLNFLLIASCLSTNKRDGTCFLKIHPVTILGCVVLLQPNHTQCLNCSVFIFLPNCTRRVRH